MPETLTQSEINEIVRQARENELYDAGGRIVKRHDWLRPDKLKKEHIRIVRSLHDSFCKTVSLTLSQSLRGQIVIDVHPEEGVQQTSYSEYLMRAMGEIEFSKPVWYTFALGSGSSVLAALEIPQDFAYFMVDKLAGGKGTPPVRTAGDPLSAVKEVGEVERDLLKKIVAHFLDEYATAWESYGAEGVRARLSRVETDPQFLSLTPSQNDVLLSIQLKVSVMPRRGDEGVAPEEIVEYGMRLCLPYSMLEPLLRDAVGGRLSGQYEEAGISEDLRENLALVNVTLRAIFGQTRVRIGDLMELQLGDILELDKPIDEPFVVTVNGSPKFFADIGKVGTRKAVEILGEWRARRYGK